MAPGPGTPKNHVFNHNNMKHLIVTLIMLLLGITAYAKPHCQGFNNYDNKVTIVITDDNVGKQYIVSDVKLISIGKGKEYPATSVKTTVQDGVATVTLTFPYITQFSNPKIALRINRKKTKIKVCQ